MLKTMAAVAICIMTFAMSAAAQTGTVPLFSGSTYSGPSTITELNGNVGIGTTNPLENLTIATPLGLTTATFGLLANGMPTWGSYNIVRTDDRSGVGNTMFFENYGGGVVTWAYNGGNPVTVMELFENRSGNGLALNDTSGNNQIFLNSSGNSYFIGGNVGIGTSSPAAKFDVNGSINISGAGAGITFPNGGGTQSVAWTGVLCGGDYAESVDVIGNRTNYGPGDVLVIDPNDSGKFLKSVEPYSTAVLGIYSTKPGALGRRQTTPKSASEVPMAMIGIVPTKVSAENGAIKPGDLLVTSSTSGYAMKGTDRSRLVGAIIGKAMGRLDVGMGVIEVGVTLQ